VCLHPSVIERFIVTAGRQLSDPARRTLRTNLRYAARRAGPQLGPPPVPLPRQQAKAPYSAAEIAGYLALADAQPTRGRRMRAAGLICLGAGAGLTGADLRSVRGTGITCRSGGVLVEVRGGDPGWCRSHPATTTCCWPRRASPEPACSPAGATPGGGT